MVAQMHHNTVSIAEAARRAGVHPNSVRHWIRCGNVEALSTPLGRVVVEESLEEALRKRAGQKEAPER